MGTSFTILVKADLSSLMLPYNAHTNCLLIFRDYLKYFHNKT
jgi:hypothetical protein